MYFFYYWVDVMELSEHGGSVPGWITDRGRAVKLLLQISVDETKAANESQESI